MSAPPSIECMFDIYCQPYVGVFKRLATRYSFLKNKKALLEDTRVWTDDRGQFPLSLYHINRGDFYRRSAQARRTHMSALCKELDEAWSKVKGAKESMTVALLNDLAHAQPPTQVELVSQLKQEITAQFTRIMLDGRQLLASKKKNITIKYNKAMQE